MAAYKETGTDKTFTVVNYIVLILLFIVVAYPLVYVVSASFSSSTAIIQGRVKLFPIGPTLKGYTAVFSNSSIITGYMNSFFYMGVGTFVNVVLTICAAYPLSRMNLAGRKFITLMFIFTMIFNAGLIPNYMLVKSVGLIDTRAVMIIPTALNVWNVMITISFFRSTIPSELLEASQIDGCNDFQFISKVVLPLSKPIIAVITLFYAVEHWNSFFDALIYLSDATKFPLTIILRDILIKNQLSAEMMMSMDPQSLAVQQNLAVLLKYSLIIIASLPLMLLYPFIQKHFVKGVMVGSVKG